MSRLNRLLKQSLSSNPTLFTHQDKLVSLPTHHLARKSSTRSLDFYQLGDKAAIEKERARLTDEMNRGYFADIKEFNKHGGKIAAANKIIIPAISALKFPDLLANYSDGRTLKLPVRSDKVEVGVEKSDVSKVSLICLSFRANSQTMIDSWSTPFQETFGDTKDVQMYEVSFIDSWFLCLSPIKHLLLRTMRKSNDTNENILQKQIVYSFGDHYYLRKELKILNLLTGYIFLLDKFGRIRWQGFGKATEEEVSSLLSCTSLLLQES